MLSEKLRSIRISLEDVQASQEDALDILRLIRRELDAAAGAGRKHGNFAYRTG